MKSAPMVEDEPSELDSSSLESACHLLSNVSVSDEKFLSWESDPIDMKSAPVLDDEFDAPQGAAPESEPGLDF